MGNDKITLDSPSRAELEKRIDALQYKVDKLETLVGKQGDAIMLLTEVAQQLKGVK